MAFQKSNIPWNKGLSKEEFKSHFKDGFIWIGAKNGHIHSEETKNKISKTLKGCVSCRKGKILSQEIKQKISLSRRGKGKGENNSKWKGGITPLIYQIRHHYLYRQWRSDVFTRDDFTCQECGHRGGYLHAHHIKSFSSILQFYEIANLQEALECEELWNINNGITLCEECHRNIYNSLNN